MALPCMCVLIIPGPGADGRGEFLNLCGSVVSGPDEPMCDNCTEAGHATHPDQMPLSDPRRAGLFGMGRLSHARG